MTKMVSLNLIFVPLFSRSSSVRSNSTIFNGFILTIIALKDKFSKQFMPLALMIPENIEIQTKI